MKRRGGGGGVVSDEAVSLPPARQQGSMDSGVVAVVGRFPSKQHLQGLQEQMEQGPHNEVLKPQNELTCVK